MVLDHGEGRAILRHLQRRDAILRALQVGLRLVRTRLGGAPCVVVPLRQRVRLTDGLGSAGHQVAQLVGDVLAAVCCTAKLVGHYAEGVNGVRVAHGE